MCGKLIKCYLCSVGFMFQVGHFSRPSSFHELNNDFKRSFLMYPLDRVYLCCSWGPTEKTEASLFETATLKVRHYFEKFLPFAWNIATNSLTVVNCVKFLIKASGTLYFKQLFPRFAFFLMLFLSIHYLPLHSCPVQICPALIFIFDEKHSTWKIKKYSDE